MLCTQDSERAGGREGGGLAQFYLVCIVVGLVVEQRWGTDRQVILQRLAQQRVAPIPCKKKKGSKCL